MLNEGVISPCVTLTRVKGVTSAGVILTEGVISPCVMLTRVKGVTTDIGGCNVE